MSDLTTLARGVNLVWVLVASFLVFFMKAGFAMLEAGQVRAKNVANQLTQTLITLIVGLGTFFVVGAAVAAVVASVSSGGPLDPVAAAAHVFAPGDVDAWTTWLFGAMFAIAAANVVSGAVAGRCRPRMYVVYTAVVAGVVYPVASGLAWNGGGLAALGFHDFAGGAVIHALGGLSGVTAAWLVGPRADRYTEDGSVNVIPGHSVTLAVLGTLILCFGWYGFNVGTAVTVFAVQDGHLSLAAFDTVGRVALNTTLGMVAGGAGAGLVAWKRTGKLDTLYLANGLLAGLVGVTAAADVLTWPGAVVLGLLAGAQLPVVFEFVEERLKIDDVCAVFPVHGSAGLLGALAYPFFATAGFSLAQFGVQVLGVAVIAAWAVGATYVLFRVGTAVGWARVDPGDERDGLDIAAHGLETYPEFGDAEPLSNRGVVTDGGYAATDGGARDIELVLAYIRPDRLGEVKRSLAEVGAPSITVSNVSGRGSQPAKTGQWRGEEYTVDLHQKVKVECVVADIEGSDVANAIRDGAKTGNKGDGKVFVLPVTQALQIRTGKRGPEAV